MPRKGPVAKRDKALKIYKHNNSKLKSQLKTMLLIQNTYNYNTFTHIMLI